VGDRAEALLAAVRVQALDAAADLQECRALSAAMQGSLARGISHCLDAAAALDADAASSHLLAIRDAGHVLIAEDLFSALAGRGIPVAGWSNEPLRPFHARPDVHGRLTQRESQVATLIKAGRSDGDIAEALGLSVRTVHAHVRSIFLKLDICRRADVDI
jgi:DNA-binding NarL/FixJ family response regulator